MQMKFNPTKYKVSCCGDVIYSRFPGEFRKCSCGQCFVDQTEYYTRYSAPDQKYFSVYVEKDEEESEEGGAS